MIDHAQALARARDWFNEGRSEHVEVAIEEFDACYVAGEVHPGADGASRPPETVGGTFLVIDKETGETSSWPQADPEIVAEDYTRRRRGGAAGG